MGSRPAPILTGVMTVAGTVDIGNRPTVTASQGGDWTVSIAEVTWSAGEREVIDVTLVGYGAWVRVSAGNQRSRWVNIALARAVGEVR